jgi:hypothetical protein
MTVVGLDRWKAALLKARARCAFTLRFRPQSSVAVILVMQKQWRAHTRSQLWQCSGHAAKHATHGPLATDACSISVRERRVCNLNMRPTLHAHRHVNVFVWPLLGSAVERAIKHAHATRHVMRAATRSLQTGL